MQVVAAELGAELHRVAALLPRQVVGDLHHLRVLAGAPHIVHVELDYQIALFRRAALRIGMVGQRALILTILRAVEAGASAVDTCRKYGITETTFYRWKRKYEGMGVAEMRRLRQLEEENKKLKQLVADLTLDKSMLQEVLRKKF